LLVVQKIFLVVQDVKSAFSLRAHCSLHYCNCSDAEKLRATYQKLVALHKEFNHQEEVIACYSAAALTYSPSDLSGAELGSYSQLWMDFSAYLVGREKIPGDCLERVCVMELRWGVGGLIRTMTEISFLTPSILAPRLIP
jgi:hypothetical protein